MATDRDPGTRGYEINNWIAREGTPRPPFWDRIGLAAIGVLVDTFKARRGRNKQSREQSFPVQKQLVRR